MHKKSVGFAILAAALLIAVVGSVVSANVLRVGMTDYEVYPCTYNANAGYYVPWDGNAAGQFWISAPRWEWGGEGVSLCADSDGSWRDNGVREGDPNPDFVDEYRRAQTAVNARRAAFSSSLVSLAEQIERGRTQAAADAAADREMLTDAQLEALYSAELVGCQSTRDAAVEAADENDREAIDAADAALGQCFHSTIRTYATTARRVYSNLQASCASNNDRATVEGETGYQACLSAGRAGSKEETGDIEFAECARTRTEPNPDNPLDPVTLCVQVPILDGHGNPVLGSDGRQLMGVELSDGRRVLDKVVYTAPIPDPEITLNPPPTPDPAATPDPTPEVTARYGMATDSDNNPVEFNQAYFAGGDCDTVTSFIDDYWDYLSDDEKATEAWMNTAALVRAIDDGPLDCDWFDD